MRSHMGPSAVTSRERAHPAAKTPYNRANAVQNLHPGVQEIINNCPAVDIFFGHGKPRSTTHSRGRGRDREHVARPPNAFMIYRSYQWFTKQLQDNDEKDLSCFSQLAGQSWKVLSEQAQAPFKLVAEIVKREHAERNPDYKYAPSSRPQKSRRQPSQRTSKAKETFKVKETTIPLNRGFESLLLPKEATPTFAGTLYATPVDASLTSSESTSSSSSPSTSPSPVPLQWVPPSLATPELGYPPRPPFRPVTSGLIPSPSMSVLRLNEDEPPPSSILDELPDKYREAATYPNVQPLPIVHGEGFRFSGARPNTTMGVSVPAQVDGIDYSSFISGDPEVKLGSPTPTVASIPNAPSSFGGCFSPGLSTISNAEDDFELSNFFDLSFFDTPALDSDYIVDETNMHDPSDGEMFDAIIACGSY